MKDKGIMLKFLLMHSMLWGIVLCGGQYLNQSTPPKEKGYHLQTLDGAQVTATTFTNRIRKNV